MEISRDLYENLLHIDYFSQCGNPIHDLFNFEVYEENSFEQAGLISLWKNETD